MKYKNIEFDIDFYDENDFFDICYEYSDEGDELPYMLEHITTEKLYKEYIEDTSDDSMLALMKGGGYRENGKGTATRDILHNKHR